jgi:hypothetical protein
MRDQSMSGGITVPAPGGLADSAGLDVFDAPLMRLECSLGMA